MSDKHSLCSTVCPLVTHVLLELNKNKIYFVIILQLDKYIFTTLIFFFFFLGLINNFLLERSS